MDLYMRQKGSSQVNLFQLIITQYNTHYLFCKGKGKERHTPESSQIAYVKIGKYFTQKEGKWNGDCSKKSSYTWAEPLSSSIYSKQSGNATVIACEQCLPVSLHNPAVQPGMAQMGLLGLELFLQLHHQTKEKKQIIKLSFARSLSI